MYAKTKRYCYCVITHILVPPLPRTLRERIKNALKACIIGWEKAKLLPKTNAKAANEIFRVSYYHYLFLYKINKIIQNDSPSCCWRILVAFVTRRIARRGERILRFFRSKLFSDQKNVNTIRKSSHFDDFHRPTPF